MACPLFIPCLPLGELVSIAPPLGDLYGGQCAADRSAAIDNETLRRLCNFGYARGKCARAAQSEADAVRLMVRSEKAGIVEIAWAIEKNHHPIAVGTIGVEIGDAPLLREDALAKQAYACAMAYKRQTHGLPERPDRIAAAAHL